MAEFRYPNITDPTPEGQLKQLKNYLYQLTNQLNYAVKSVESENKAEEYVNALKVSSSGSGANSADKNAKSTFNDIKGLIIKSADIVNAYYDVISKKLESNYLALARTEDGYDAFYEDMAQWRTESPEDNTDYFKSVQKIAKILGHELDENGKPIIPENEIISQIRTDDFYIKVGWLKTEEDGSKIGGIELGQISSDGTNTESSFAHFTTEELVFYDEWKNPVAVLSKNLLNITNAKIGGYLELNDYMLDNSDGVAFLWAGDD